MSYADAMHAHRKAEADKELADLPLGVREDPLLHNGTPTSKAAAVKSRSKASGDRELILQVLTAYGPQTRKQLVANAMLPENSVNPRCVELLAKNLIHEKGVHEGRAILHYGPKP